MAVINTNVKALFSQMALKTSGLAQSTAMQQLSTGKRINSARDDAAGMAIATRMTHQIRSLNQAVRNAGDAISLIQTAEGATNEITDMLQRMRELSIQAVNDTNDNAQRSYLDLEFQQLKQQIVQIADNTEWNGFPLLSGKAGEQVGEMPVYKATSINLAGQVFIDPTTSRTLEGGGVGEQQTVTFTLPSGGLTAPRTITVGGVDVTIDSSITTSAELAAHIKSVLDQSTQFGASSGRSVSIDPNTTNALVVTFAAAEGDANPLSFATGGSSISMSTPTTTLQAVTKADETFAGNGKFLLSGALTIQKATDDKITASFLTSDNQTVDLVGTFEAATGKVKFRAADGINAKVISDDLSYTLKDSADAVLSGDPTDPLQAALAGSGRALKLSVAVSGSIPAMRTGDLIINGVDIGSSYASDDKLSPANNAAGSAIAKAAAINRKAAAAGVTRGETQTLTFSGNPTPGVITVGGVAVTLTSAENTSVLATAKIASALRASPQFGPDTGRNISYASGGTVINIDFPPTDGDVSPTVVQSGQTALAGLVDTTTPFSNSVPGTGVFAKVNENVMTGKAMSGDSVASGVVFINGFASANINTVLNNPRETRIQVARAINMISDKTGVKAIDTGSDNQGISMVAADGRNIEVRFETTSNANLFGDRTGLREGVQSSTISLESKIPTAVVLGNSATGDIGRVGLVAGNFTKNQSVYNTAARDIVGPDVAQVTKVKVNLASVAASSTAQMSVVINGTTYNSTSFATLATSQSTAVRSSLVTAINADANSSVTASMGQGTDELLITSKVPGVPFTISTTKTFTGTVTGSITSETVVPSQMAPVKSLGLDDLAINGVPIRAATTADDIVSNTVATSSNPASSAIAMANAINASTPETGVRAVPNPVEIKGTGDTITQNTSTLVNGVLEPVVAPIGMQSLYVNGTEIQVDFKLNEDADVRRNKVVAAINERTGQHGVTAENNGKGVTLKSDGRNLSVWFDSNVDGLQPASFGLDQGGAKSQVSSVKLGGAIVATNTVDVNINGVVVSTTVGTVTAPATTGPMQAALDMVAAINARVANPTATPPLNNLKAYIDPNDSTSVLLQSTVPGTSFKLNGANSNNAAATVTLDTVQKNSYGDNGITGIQDAMETTASARTLYGTVRLIAGAAQLPGLPGTNGIRPSPLGLSGKPITISTGADGFGPQSNFSDLGFQVGGFGGRSSEDMDPPRVGRLAFQVGASANQTVTIDLADFGKGGPITGEITGDVDLAVENRSTRINTREGATAVLNLLDTAMDKVNATRATMGAVMNRLDHVINNLTNVSMNMSASRSQIEDADYASASTELAKTQIMQQAATAVLAQANTSQQSVLKLLGN